MSGTKALDELAEQSNWYKNDDGETGIRWEWAITKDPPISQAAAELAQLKARLGMRAEQITRDEKELAELKMDISKLSALLAERYEIYLKDQAEMVKLRAELEEAKDTISRIQKKARLDIPVYAYADNQAAVDMAVSLAEIADIVAAFLAAHPEETKNV